MAKSSRVPKIPLVFAAILLIAACALGGWLYQMTQAAHPSPSPNTEISSDSLFPEVDWAYWQAINPDVIGWVTVPDTGVDYPIVQAPADDPEYYLHHDVYKNWSIYGVPYLDAACKDIGLLSSRNAVVFGHHMNDGSMFAAFADYSDPAFASDHAVILVQTPDAKQVYSTRLVEIVNGAELAKRTDFKDEADYRAWYDEQVSDAVVALDAEIKPQTVMTFCTCSYNYSSNERTLVIASAQNSLEKETDVK